MISRSCLYIWVIGILACLVDTAAGQQLPMTGRLYVGTIYNYSVPRFFWSSRENCSTDEVITCGTYWAISHDGMLFYVTAGHVLGINVLPSVIDGKKVNGRDSVLHSVKTRAYLSPLAYTVAKVGKIEHVEDLALLITDEYDPIPAATLSCHPPKVGEKVSVCGFPGTSFQQIEELVVTSVHETNAKSSFFVLNGPVDPGFSGGAVVAADGTAYGVVVNTDQENKQTTVLRMTPAMLQKVEWQPAESVLFRKFQ